MFSTTVSSSDWLREVCERQPEVARLLAAPVEEQQRRGYFHTLREILQQPSSWIHTAEQMASVSPSLRAGMKDVRALVLTGSGSSEYVGHCVRLALQERLGVSTLAIGGGVLLTNSWALPRQRPALVVSLARSGDSPESVGVLSLLLETEPGLRHLVLTCNAKGKLATRFRNDPRVHVIALADSTNDRSLVMTSSFTNLLIALHCFAFLEAPEAYQSQCRKLSAIAGELLMTGLARLAEVSALDFRRAIFLGTGVRFGAAREAALKMLEMTSGRVCAVAETYLGLRHGPMSYVHKDTLIVCFLSSDKTLRAYESDLIRELDRKNLGMLKIIVGDDVPPDLLRDQDVVISCPGLAEVGDSPAPVVDVVVGQVLGLFRCLREGLRPDSPSESGVINRVVQSFKLHFPAGVLNGERDSSGSS
ncbi:MAG TPA: SIS domain-containing protein [Terriglobales bacterium]|nr:SIS domain-containing protein [Terriglobales bacterium]